MHALFCNLHMEFTTSKFFQESFLDPFVTSKLKKTLLSNLFVLFIGYLSLFCLVVFLII